MNLSTVTAALASQIQTATSLRVSSIVPAKVNPPAAFIDRAALNYLLDQDSTGDPGMVATLSLTVVTASSDFERGQQALDEYLSPSGTKSIYGAVAADATLGDTCDYALVRGVEDVGTIEIAGNLYIGGRFVVEVVG